MVLSIHVSVWELRLNMENENNLNNDFTIIEGQKTIDAGSEVNDIDGTEIASSDFTLVQQDKSIHDTKFKTKPTTFFKDAMKRFTKNHSSVAGAIILGVIFLLAIILPIDGVLPYDVSSKHTKEQNLPMKLFEPTQDGGDFWNGTRWVENQAFPYEEEFRTSKYIGTQYEDDSAIINVRNVKKEYLSEGYSAAGSGGYVRVAADKSDSKYTTYLVSQTFNYDFAHDYKITFTLGGCDTSTYKNATEVFLYMRVGSTSVPLTTLDNFKKVETELADKQSVYDFESYTFDNVSELVKEACTQKNIKFKDADGKNISSIDGAENLYLSARLGVAFSTSTESDTAIYLKNYTITSDNEDEKADLEKRSFTNANGTFDSEKNTPTVTGGSEDNPYYWIASGKGKQIVDAYTRTCDILYDEYLLTYGYAKETVSQSQMDSWLGVYTDENGKEVSTHEPWIVLDHTNPQLGKIVLTEEGKKHEDEIFVTDIVSQERTTSTTTGKIIYNYTCRVLKYKEMGYSSMPVHLFGTEDGGRDLLKYTFRGTLISIGLGLIVSAINILIGIIWGSISGYFGGVTDIVMERIVDILSGIPSIVLLTVLTLKIGSDHPMVAFALALCLTGWIGTESVTRSQFYRYRGREYVLAARTLGARAPRLIFKHILPNAIGTIVTSSVLMIPSVIFSEATISYLGLGLQGVNSLGIILSDAQKFLNVYSYQLLLPALIISLLMICFNLFGNGLRDAFNPSLKGSD